MKNAFARLLVLSQHKQANNNTMKETQLAKVILCCACMASFTYLGSLAGGFAVEEYLRDRNTLPHIVYGGVTMVSVVGMAATFVAGMYYVDE
jgi:hypothetical protein